MFWLQEISPWWVACIIIFLLWVDLFISVPTTTLSILSGYFLGFGFGLLAISIGMIVSGLTGYFLSKHYGRYVLCKILPKEKERQELKKAFQNHGFIMIILARAVPILPEVTACLAGLTSMRFTRFLQAWLLCSVPYAMIMSFAGSASTLDNPEPAVVTAIVFKAILWIGWFFFSKKLIYSAST